MSRANDLRLRKLEAKQFGRDEERTFDELAVFAYECALAVLGDAATPEADKETAKNMKCDIEERIISQVRKLQDPEYQAWLKQFERGNSPAWGHWSPYVPAVTGHGNGMSEYSDLDKPNIMERRRALWARESVLGLVADLTQCGVFGHDQGARAL
ncbi:hypothetical protein ACVIIW_006244 [Bradyrhizobium sp. USDA 4449]